MLRSCKPAMRNNVHSDVIFDILVRLPVKPLLRFKCVSKHWCSLISNPIFVKRHVDLAIIDKDVERARRKLLILAEKEIENERGNNRLLSSPYLDDVECEAVSSNHLYLDDDDECKAMSSNHIYLDDDDDDDDDESMSSNHIMAAIELDFPLITSSFDKVNFISSFNGLVCLCLGKENVFLFNPATKELKKLPDSSIVCDISLATTFYEPKLYGFSYDHSFDDYNVVKFLKNLDVYVYSLKTDTWTRVEYFPCDRFFLNPFKKVNGVHITPPGVLFNGAVHWVPPGSVDRKTRTLCNLKNEVALLKINGSLLLDSPREDTYRKVLIPDIHGKILETVTYVESFVSPS